MKIGRNDVCPCGSGQKYKKCCLKADQQQGRESRAEEQRKLLLPPETTAGDESPTPPKPRKPDPEPVDPRFEAMERLWKEFQAADYEQQHALFLNSLPDEDVMDEEQAFQMLEELFSAARKQQDMGRFDLLVGALREGRPEIYDTNVAYILQWQIEGALSEGRHDDADAFALQFATVADKDADIYSWTLDILAYHGRLETLAAMARVAWPAIRDSSSVVEWAKDDYAFDGWRWELYQQLDADVPELPVEERFQWFDDDRLDGQGQTLLAHLRGHEQQDCADKNLWTNRKKEYPTPLARLTYDFAGYLHREKELSLSKVELARQQLLEYLDERHAGRLNPRPSMMDVAMNRPKPKPHPKPVHPLCPDHGSFDQFLGGLIGGMFSNQLHAAMALFEVAPAWLEFLEQRGAIDDKIHATVLLELAPLVKDITEGAEDLQVDPLLANNIGAAWKAQELSHEPASRV